MQRLKIIVDALLIIWVNLISTVPSILGNDDKFLRNSLFFLEVRRHEIVYKHFLCWFYVIIATSWAWALKATQFRKYCRIVWQIRLIFAFMSVENEISACQNPIKAFQLNRNWVIHKKPCVQETSWAMRKNVIHLITNKVDLLIDRVFNGAWIFWGILCFVDAREEVWKKKTENWMKNCCLNQMLEEILTWEEEKAGQKHGFS